MQDPTVPTERAPARGEGDLGFEDDVGVAVTLGIAAATRLPIGAWDADLVRSGHDHTNERVELDGVSCVVNGLGGTTRYSIGVPVPGSAMRFADGWGALRLVLAADRFETSWDGLR